MAPDVAERDGGAPRRGGTAKRVYRLA